MTTKSADKLPLMTWDSPLTTYRQLIASTFLLDQKTKEDLILDFKEIFGLYNEFEKINLENIHFKLPL